MPEKNVLVRPVLEPDIPTLAKFEAEISIISFAEEAITDLAFHEKKIRKSYEKGSGGRDGMLVLTIDGEVGGWLWMDAKENFLTGESYINFRSFYIVEKLRGGKESALLMERGMDYCRKKNARSIVGKVHVDNGPMRALYKNFNFKPTHITMEYHFESPASREEKQ